MGEWANRLAELRGSRGIADGTDETARVEAAYRAAFTAYWSLLYDRAGAMIAGDRERLAELEPAYQDAKAAWFVALDERSRVCFPDEGG